MKINRIAVYQFGKLVNKIYDITQDGMVIISGNNESGKTHLRYFLTYMLIGLTKKEIERFNQRPNQVFGGELSIQVNERTFKLYRTENSSHQLTIKDEQDHSVPENDFNKYIQQVDREFFDRVFHFDALSIQKEHMESPEQLGNVLLSLSMSGADAIERAEKDLKKKLDQLFKKGGSKPELNQQLDKLEKIEKELHELKETERDYHAMEDAIKQKKNLMKQKDDDINKVKNTLDFYRTYQQLYRDIESYHLATQYLEQHSKPEINKTANQADVSDWYEKLRDLSQKLEYQRNMIARENNKISENEQKMGDNQLYQFLLDIVENDTFWRQQNQLYLQTETEYKQILERIQEEKRQLGLSIETDVIKALELPEENVRELDHLISTDQRLAEELTEKKAEFNMLTTEGDALSLEIKHLEEQMISVYQRQDIEAAIESIKTTQHPVNKRKILLNFIMPSVLLMISLVIVYLFSLFNPGVVISLVIAYMIGIFVLMFLNTGKELIDKKVLTEKEKEQLQNYYEILNQDDIAREKYEKSTNNWKSFATRIEIIEHDMNKYKEKRAHFARDINRFKKRYPFLENVVESGYSRVLNSVYKLKRLLEDQDALLAKLKDEEKRLNHVKQSIVEYCGVSRDMTVDGMLGFVQNQFSELTHVREHQAELIEEFQQLMSEAEQIDAKMEPISHKLSEVYQEYQVENYDEFIVRHENLLRYKEMQQLKNDMKQKLNTYFSPQEIQDIQSNTIINESFLKEKLSELNQKQEQLNKDHLNLFKQISELKSKKDQMETSTNYRDLTYQFEMKREAFNQLANKWLVYKISYEKLLKTKRLFQTSMLPNIFNHASDVFAYITDDRYDKISYNDTTNDLFVSGTEAHILATDLSQGTLDQLVISIRLGVATVLNQSIDLPFIIDDSFVHFDDSRKNRLLDYLNNYDRQIFYFTTESKSDLENDNMIQLKDEFYLSN